MLENWQSEYLQFTLFIVGTVWLVQKGSPESKALGQDGHRVRRRPEARRARRLPPSPSWARVGGLRTRVFSNSLLLVMAAIWRLLLARAVRHRPDRLQRRPARPPRGAVSWLAPTSTTPDFWNRTLQNWQSEFLAIGSMAVLSIYLRQRGSPESKPVGAAHEATGIEG